MIVSLDLELIKPTTPPALRLTWVGALTLLIGIAVFMVTYQSYVDLNARQTIVNEQLQTFEQTTQKVKKATTTVTRSQIKPDQLNAIKLSVHEIFIPWDGLFNALEDSSINHVVLLGLQPDSKKKQVIIAGEANNYLSVIAYIDQLAKQPVFTEVYLKKHAVKETDADKPVSFSIFARWSTSSKESAI